MRRSEPDTAEGNYYVSVRDGRRSSLLVGPFPNDHATALRFVDAARDAAHSVDPKAWFYRNGGQRSNQTAKRLVGGEGRHFGRGR